MVDSYAKRRHVISIVVIAVSVTLIFLTLRAGEPLSPAFILGLVGFVVTVILARLGVLKWGSKRKQS
jgi:multisubunit Na+/H+ antiporter MnhF subunit